MIKIISVLTLLFCINSQAITFNEALDVLKKHESIESIIHKADAINEEAQLRESWGDPKFKIAAKNFPSDTLSYNQTPMTGVEFGIIQKVPLTAKYKTIKNSIKALSQSYKYKAKDKNEYLTKTFWEILILRKKTSEELSIFKENIMWVKKMLKVSKTLYATGKVSQQAILDIQIRKSEIESDISNKNYELLQINDKLTYLIGDFEIEEKSIPWDSLEVNSIEKVDYRELALQEKLEVKEHSLAASKLDYIPDLTVSFSYTKRSNIDGNGDFIGASIIMDIPISQVKDAKYAIATQEKLQASKNYENYKKGKNRDIALLSKEIKKITREIEILTNKMIKFSMNSREITSRAYALGESSYIELLQSELKLQNILMRKVMLEAKRDSKLVALKYIKGEALNE